MKTTHINTTLSLFDDAGEPTAHALEAARTSLKAAPPQLTNTTTPTKAKRPRTGAERDAYRAERASAAKAILEGGLSNIATDTEALARYLRFRSHFHSYSPSNAILLMLQGATTMCMGYRTWLGHGRQVRRGEKGLMVYAPVLTKPTKEEIAGGADPDKRVVRGFRVATTFDYAQTDATREGALTYESPSTRLGADSSPELAGRLRALAAAWGYTVEKADGYADGYCNFATRTIGVQSGLSADDEAAVLAHELAHAAAHEPKKGTEAAKLTSAERELQAEGAAFMALYQMGLDTSRASLPYLGSYAEDDAALMAQLAEIERIAALIVSGITEAEAG